MNKVNQYIYLVLLLLLSVNSYAVEVKDWLPTDDSMYKLLRDPSATKVTNTFVVGEDNEFIVTMFKTFNEGFKYYRCVHNAIDMERVGCWILFPRIK